MGKDVRVERAANIHPKMDARAILKTVFCGGPMDRNADLVAHRAPAARENLS